MRTGSRGETLVMSTAIVVYQLFLMVQGESFSFGDIIKLLTHVSVGADTVIEISLTLAMSYLAVLAYFTAQGGSGMSEMSEWGENFDRFILQFLGLLLRVTANSACIIFGMIKHCKNCLQINKFKADSRSESLEAQSTLIALNFKSYITIPRRWENHIEQHKNDSMQQDVGSVQILTVSQAETSSAIDWCHELQIDKVLFVSDNACHKWCNSCSTGSEDRNLVQHYVLFFI
ncbi:hypothetical protein C5167_028940 [Papaver somniferum]|nr:hypothetical protein C5167_028940 [Papaver somniferum]